MTKSAPSKPISLDDCREYLTTHLFQLRPKDYEKTYPKWPGTVGLEVEMLPLLHPAQANLDPRVVPLQGSGATLASSLRQLAQEQAWSCLEDDSTAEASSPLLMLVKTDQGDNLSFEPGGQLEFSSLPYPCLSDAVRRLRSMQTLLDQTLAPHHWQLLQVGINPWHRVDHIGLQMTKGRYRAMDSYFTRIGPFGRRMMRQTCTVQVCLDFGPDESTLVQRYLASQLLAPIAAAIFAFSPFVDNKDAGMDGFRTFVWRNLDDSRTGFPKLGDVFATPNKEACITSYLNYLLDAKVVFVEALDYLVPDSEVTFRQWVLGGIKGHYPSLSDLQTHISLQFPEVRPRGFLELRSVDCQARPWQVVPAAFYTGLLYDPTSLASALNYLEAYSHRLPQLMHTACHGLQDAELASMAQHLMGLAYEGFNRLPPCFRGEGTEKALKIFGERYTFKGKTPAQELRDTVKAEGRSRPALTTYQKLNEQWHSLLQ